MSPNIQTLGIPSGRPTFKSIRNLGRKKFFGIQNKDSGSWLTYSRGWGVIPSIRQNKEMSGD